MSRKDFDLDKAGALETADAVRSGKVSALDVCDAAIARIERLDGPINAVVVRDFDRARAAAKALDQKGARGDTRPLIGVAMTVKESNDIAGLPSTWGFEHFKTLPVREDAIAVARLKAAGAILLGKTNVPVALGDWQSANPIHGRTVNPHDHTRSAGGSSGGGAAAVAAGMVPLESGSDIGGSVRVPAHMCGIYGHKPTYGVIPLKGHGFPGADGAEPPLAVLGPLARNADDVTAAFDVLAGPLPGVGYKLDLPAARHRALKEYRVLVIDTHPVAKTDASVRDPLNSLAGSLERIGARVVRSSQDLPNLVTVLQSYSAMLMTVISRGTPGAKPIDAFAWLDAVDEQARTMRRWASVFNEVDVVLAPPFGVPAFPHQDSPNWESRTLTIDGEATPYGVQVAWSTLATFANLPATVAPIAKTSEGLPVGVQIIGPAFGDQTTLAFAALLQREGLAT